jgi:hypothetical protein
MSEEAMRRWPLEAVRARKTSKLLVRASSAASVVCPGCQQQCTMQLHTRFGIGDTDCRLRAILGHFRQISIICRGIISQFSLQLQFGRFIPIANFHIVR